MYAKASIIFSLMAAIGYVAATSQQHPAPSAANRFALKRSHRASFYLATPWFAAKAKPPRPAPSATPLPPPHPDSGLDISTHFSEAGDFLPMWTYNIRSARDGHTYQGAVVGHNPFGTPGTDHIPTLIVPLVIRTHRIATAVDPTTFRLINIVDGDTTIDPTLADHTCLPDPNNVPATVIQQSPMFTPTRFVFGGTDVGITQYLDAHQRASFWNVLGSRVDDYHVLLDPVQLAPPSIVDVPPNEGIAITDPHLFGTFSFCAPLQLLNFLWLDTYLNQTVLPQLSQLGVNNGTLPVFLQYNSMEGDDITQIACCFAVGYHAFVGDPFGTQTYAVADFDTTGLFTASGDGLGTEILAHEIGEWGNDPYALNEAPPWGNVGQVIGGCQDDTEVGDPLSGTNIPNITMPNGFSYRIQELAFFSWFFGPPSTAANGWYSNNNTFTTDAGHVCP